MTENRYSIREATANDLPAIARSLAWAIEWRSPTLTESAEGVIHRTGRDYLLEGWGRGGDVAFVAHVAGTPVGAAWCRRWTEEQHSYGYVDAATPEIAIGVEPEWRGCGVGSALLAALVDAATLRGIARLSLSVESDNPAMALYEKSGFARLELVVDSWTMVKDLEALTSPV